MTAVPKPSSTLARNLRRPRLVAAIALPYAAVYAAWLFWHFGPSSWRNVVADAFFLPLDAIVVWCAAGAARRCSREPRLARAWWLVAAALGSTLAGDVIYSVYELLGAPPYPSAADPFYLAFYPLMIAAFIAVPSSKTRRALRWRYLLDSAGVAVGGTLVVSYLELGPAVSSAAHESPAGASLAIAYPVCDLLLIVCVATLVLRELLIAGRHTLLKVAAGLFLFVAADVVYGFQQLHDTYREGTWVDGLWFAAACLFGLAALRQPTPIGETGVGPGRERANALPYLATGGGIAVLVATDIHEPFFFGLAAPVAVGLLALLAGTRQLLVQRQLQQTQDENLAQARHDDLTGLANRRLLIEELERALGRCRRGGSRVALLLLDLNDFKLINDSLGHSAGDELLNELAARLAATVRQGEFAARLGGDEFCVVAEGQLEAPSLQSLGERILACLDEPFVLADGPHHITGALGIAAADSESAAQPTDMLRDADTAMYDAKARGESLRLFDRQLRDELLGEMRAADALTAAVANDEIAVLLQPLFDSRSLEPVAVEALSRWPGAPTPMGPSEFIPLARRHGLLSTLGEQIAARAFGVFAGLREQDPACLPDGIWLNVSASELGVLGYADTLLGQLAEQGLRPADLAVELVESVMIDSDDPAIADNLALLQRRGVRLVLDDFGTGYSALASLKTLPLHAVKLDRLFVASLHGGADDAPVTRAVVQLGRALGLQVVAEGVETDAQLALMRSLGCHLLQGFLLGRPADAADLADRLMLSRLVQRSA